MSWYSIFIYYEMLIWIDINFYHIERWDVIGYFDTLNLLVNFLGNQYNLNFNESFMIIIYCIWNSELCIEP